MSKHYTETQFKKIIADKDLKPIQIWDDLYYTYVIGDYHKHVEVAVDELQDLTESLADVPVGDTHSAWNVLKNFEIKSRDINVKYTDSLT